MNESYFMTSGISGYRQVKILFFFMYIIYILMNEKNIYTYGSLFFFPVVHMYI